jgi:hypothetical protein
MVTRVWYKASAAEDLGALLLSMEAVAQIPAWLGISGVGVGI